MSQNQASSPADAKRTTAISRIVALIPGILLCIAVAGVSALLERAELGIFQHPYVEALVMAILLGMAVRSFWKPAPRWQSGIAFSAKQLLEVAVMLLGASISFAAIAASGVALLASIAAVVVVALCVSFGISRLLGLSTRLSILIACGNSICGNSAIAAVAPIIGANNDEIASSISFTAILGVMMVLGLPLLIPLLQLSATQYGILAGLTVYAVPQVLAATVPAGLVSTQIGTLVKLMRVLMLGPVVVGLADGVALAQRCQEDQCRLLPPGPVVHPRLPCAGDLALARDRAVHGDCPDHADHGFSHGGIDGRAWPRRRCEGACQCRGTGDGGRDLVATAAARH